MIEMSGQHVAGRMLVRRKLNHVDAMKINRGQTTHYSLRMNVHEDSKANLNVTATFELQGLKGEDVSVEVNNNQWAVQGGVYFRHQ
ncbi:hypothetical protein C8Q75DRAFT_184406 [Abortiporus biennis]|nr:hypothetical protein C8Q75DRAFT_184406 [Abortiporus biennis]